MADYEWTIGEPGNDWNMGKVGDYWEENGKIYYLYRDHRDISSPMCDTYEWEHCYLIKQVENPTPEILKDVKPKPNLKGYYFCENY
jgi:hypothetical protein